MPICRQIIRTTAFLAACLWASTAVAEIEKASRILVDKSERTLVLFADGRPIRSYPISLGLNPRGHKRYEGDKRTPEGVWVMDKSFNGQMWADVEVKGEPSKWITYFALLVLDHFD